MAKAYISPKLRTFSTDCDEFMTTSITKGETIEDINAYQFLSKENDTPSDDKSIWDSAW